MSSFVPSRSVITQGRRFCPRLPLQPWTPVQTRSSGDASRNSRSSGGGDSSILHFFLFPFNPSSSSRASLSLLRPLLLRNIVQQPMVAMQWWRYILAVIEGLRDVLAIPGSDVENRWCWWLFLRYRGLEVVDLRGWQVQTVEASSGGKIAARFHS